MLIGFFPLAWALPGEAKSAGTIEQSVVKVISVVADPSYEQPWQAGPQSMQSGSGVVIEGGLILTNAHVIANQTYVQVQRQGDPNKYPARVRLAGHECDLALLEVADPKFHQDLRPLGFGEMPKLRDKVAAYGFPIGGDKLSITEGVVSRLEMGQYSHCWKNLLLIQIDAAINPGNSGGPVIRDNKIVGIAFQGMGGADNVGYMIPPPVIRHFLKDAEDGKYDGFPGLGLEFQDLENPQHRAQLGLKPDQTGVMVTRISFDSSSWDALKPGDVLMAIDGQEIANDATIPFPGGERIMFSYALLAKFPGDPVRLDVLRQGKQQALTLTLKDAPSIISTCEFDVMPSYYIFGGFVLTPLTLNYLESADPNRWWFTAPPALRYHLVHDVSTPERRQVVVLQYVLADEVNVGYHDVDNEVVTKVNGQDVKDLKDLVQKIESSTADYIELETEEGDKMVLSSADAKSANPRIMTRYRIGADRSEDLKEGEKK
jgi:S1-C subfamily serine protease